MPAPLLIPPYIAGSPTAMKSATVASHTPLNLARLLVTRMPNAMVLDSEGSVNAQIETDATCRRIIIATGTAIGIGTVSPVTKKLFRSHSV